MKSIADIVRGVRRDVKTIDDNFSELFNLPEEELGKRTGTFEEVALAHAVLRLRAGGCVCLSCESAGFTSIRTAILDSAENVKALQQTYNGGNHDEAENRDGDTGGKGG